MTGKQRLLRALRGEEPDFVPFSPNLYYWFYHHRRCGTLPPELAGAEHPLDALRCLGADILARWDTRAATREIYTAGEYSEEYAGQNGCSGEVVTAFNRYPAGRTLYRQRLATPHAVLVREWTFQPEAGTDFETGFWWKSWEEYPAIRFLLEAREYEFDSALFRKWAERVGDQGLVMADITQSPLKTFHWLAGAENVSYFLADHPAEMRELARLHEAKALALVERIAADPAVDVLLALDDMDSTFYSPRLYRDYCHSFFAQAAEIIHAHRKILMVHACGKNRLLLPLAGQSKVDCLEGITPPPTGDVALAQARALSGYRNFTVNGGMDVTRQEISGPDAQELVHAYTRDLFRSMPEKRHFIFASSCSTSLRTPWQTLRFFRDAAREYGRLD